MIVVDLVGEVLVTDGAVVGWWVMFGKIVSQVIGRFVPFEIELGLGFSVTEPMISHVNGSGSALLDCVLDKSEGSSVVERDRSGRLGMVEFLKGYA